MTNMHGGQYKSGVWLLEASQHYALDVRPDAIPAGGFRNPAAPTVAPKPQSTPQTAADEPWMHEDWRNGNGGSFRSNIRPKMSSDVPHPSEVLNPADKRQQGALQRLSQVQDPEHDPWGVLDGSGKSFEDLVRNHQSHLQQASPEQNYEGRVWYRAAHEGTKDLADKTTGDHGRAVATMAAFSPKTSWDENLEKGHHFLTHYNGDPNFTMPGMGNHVEKAKAIYHAPSDEYKNVVTGPKTSSFAHNILDSSPLREPRPDQPDDAGYYQLPKNPHTGESDWRMHPDQDVTIDTHHVRMANTPPGTSLGGMLYETPPHFGKKIAINGQKIDPSYDLYSRAAWEATRRHNAMQADPERHIIPKQNQAVAWTKFKHDVDTDPASNKKQMPEPGQQPKSMGPLTNPIPRYQKELSPEWWNDPRRPEVHLRQTPNWHNRNRAVAASRVATADNGSLWGKMLGDYIRRNPQHRPKAAPPQPAPAAPAPKHHGAIEKSWYTPATQAQRAPARKTIQPRGNPYKTPSKLYKQHGFHVDAPGQITGMHHGEYKSGPWLLTAAGPDCDHDSCEDMPAGVARERLRHRMSPDTKYDAAGMTRANEEYVRMRNDWLKGGSLFDETVPAVYDEHTEPDHAGLWGFLGRPPSPARAKALGEAPDWKMPEHLLPSKERMSSHWFVGTDHNDPLVGDINDTKHRQDDIQDECLPGQICGSRWFVADQDVDGIDPDKSKDGNPGPATSVTPGAAGTGPQYSTATDPHASPADEAKPGLATAPSGFGHGGPWAAGGGGGSSGGIVAPGVGGVGGGSTTPVNYTPSSGVEQWTPQIEEGLRRNGLPTTPDYVNRVKHQMGTESSGNPKAINKTDSNAAAGHPSQGLMQTIPGTFNQYHLPGDSMDITDPQANIDSAIGYGKSRYGPTLMDSHGNGIGSGHGY